MTKEPYNSKELTATQADKWRADFPQLDLVPIITDNDIDISNLKSAIIIFHAVWSGYSYQYIPKILETLNSLQTTKNIYIVNIDNVSLDFIKSYLGQLCNGYGEAAYLSDGKVISKYTDKNTFEPFLDYLKNNIKS